MPETPVDKTIVITGCSSGFGRVTALQLARSGWHVFATVRREADRESLLVEAANQGCKENLGVLLCDITDGAQIADLAKTISSEVSRLDALLNNAGTAYAGPLELVSPDDLRQQFEINVIAHVAVTQALLPLLKAAKGIIINVSSVSGRVATPVIGPYAASKFALEAISDAWRVELAHFGVRVVLIEPSSSTTGIWNTSKERAVERLEAYRNGPYRRLLNVMEKMVANIDKNSFPPQLFAETVQKILSSRKPRTRYVIPARSTWMIRMRKFLPDRLWDRQVRRTLRW
ncbi:MAG TPA: SDR family NAD(P)-dependent oxidoreductase [Ktedonobacteraceae bacterium]|jgi:NAD(P)-dependent dehydrogenase (short-subunit alcohol dehydrogenase family)|nr:SDR family NAD(P)-dependent oxidoreductase [Ktedonobacteraceae bacterium]